MRSILTPVYPKAVFGDKRDDAKRQLSELHQRIDDAEVILKARAGRSDIRRGQAKDGLFIGIAACALLYGVTQLNDSPKTSDTAESTPTTVPAESTPPTFKDGASSPETAKAPNTPTTVKNAAAVTFQSAGAICTGGQVEVVMSDTHAGSPLKAMTSATGEPWNNIPSEKVPQILMDLEAYNAQRQVNVDIVSGLPIGTKFYTPDACSLPQIQ